MKRAPVFSNIMSLADSILALASPFMILAFIVLMIMFLDAFGSHLQMLMALDQDGVVSTGRLSYYFPGDKYALVKFDTEENGRDGVIVRTKYYSAATLSRLGDGQIVRVRYVYPPKHEGMAVFENAYDEVRHYTGYLTEFIWPFLISWLCIIFHPEILYLGLTESFSSNRTTEEHL
jgi:hypothetical protein